VAHGLATNDHVVILATDFTPLAAARELGQTSKVNELALLANLCECSSVGLANSNEFTSSAGGPSFMLSVY
jgi:hypothetical protein